MAAAKRLVVVELGLTAASNCAFNEEQLLGHFLGNAEQ